MVMLICKNIQAGELAAKAELKTTAWKQKSRPIYPGQVFSFNRGSDGYTDPDIFPDHELISEKLIQQLRELTPAIDAISFAVAHTRFAEPVYEYAEATKTLILSLELLEYLRFNKKLVHGQQLAETLVLQALSTVPGLESAAQKILQTKDKKMLTESTKAVQAFMLIHNGLAAERKPLKIEGISLNVKAGDFAGNTEKIIEALAAAKRRGVALTVLPELIVSSYVVADASNQKGFLEKQSEAVRQIRQFLNEQFARDVCTWLEQQKTIADKSKKDYIQKALACLKEIDDRLDQENWLQGDFDTVGSFLKQDLVEKSFEAFLESPELFKKFKTQYEAFGMACILPALLPTGGQPYNGAYIFRKDGSLAIQLEKQRLADDPSSYFFEKHIFKPGNPNKQYNFLIDGWVVGVSDCEDMWQEADHKINAKLCHTQGGITLDKRLIDRPLHGAELLLNVSASPEQVAKLIPHKLSGLNFAQQEQPLYIIEGSAYTFESPRSDTRKDLISTVAGHHGTPFMYVNSLGGYDHILMAGASFLYDGRGQLLGTSKQHRDAVLGATYLPSGEVYVDPRNLGDYLSGPAEQAIDNMVLSVADYALKTGKSYLTLYNNGSSTGLLLQRVLRDAQKLHSEYVAADIIRTAQQDALNPKALPQDIAKLLEREKKLRVKTFIMPTMNHRVITETFSALYSALRNQSEIQFSMIFFPDMAFNPDSPLNNPIVKTGLYVFGVSSLFVLGISFLIVWPLINLGLRLLSPIIRGLIKLMGGRGERLARSYAKELERQLEKYNAENAVHIPVSETVVKELKAEVKDLPRKKLTRIQRRLRLSTYVNAFLFDLISALRATLVSLDLKVKEAQGNAGVHIGSLTGTKKIRGRFAAGGVESMGFSPAQTLSKSEVDVCYLELIKKDLAAPLSPIGHLLLSAELSRRLTLMANWIESDPLPLKIFKTTPGLSALFWPLNQTGIKQYKLSVWREILAQTAHPVRKQQLERLVKKLEKQLDHKELKEKRTPPKVISDNEKFLAWKYRPTRLNNVAPEVQLSLIDKYLTAKNLKQLVMLKDFIDHEGTMNWAAYAHFLAYNITRYDSSKHKNAGIRGPIFNIKTPGSHTEIVSQESEEYAQVLNEVQQYIAEMKSVRLLSAQDARQKTKEQTVLVVAPGKNGWVERDYEVQQLRKNIAGLSASRYPLIIIDGLNGATDMQALTIAREHKIKAMVVTSPEEMVAMRIPENIADIEYFYAFDSRQEKEAFLSELRKK